MKLNEEKRIIEYPSHKMQIIYCREFKNPAIIYFSHATDLRETYLRSFIFVTLSNVYFLEEKHFLRIL